MEADLVNAAAAKPDSDVDSAAIEFAWRVNQEIADWTGKVDTKAAIVLPFESAVFGLVVSLSSKDHLFTHLTGWRLWLLWVGVSAFIGALFFSAMVVMPQLNRRRLKRRPKQNAMYFGILRGMDGEELLAWTQAVPHAQLMMLCQHLHDTSAICWRKHSWLQSSMVLLLNAAGLFAVAWRA